MLGETKNFNVFTIYNQLNYEELIFNHLNKIEKAKKNEINKILEDRKITTRKTDSIEVTADYEQEYAFLFEEKYLSKKITVENKDLFDEMCKKICYISENKKPILLKNPHDFPNFLYIKEIYPNAKFVFIHRNPLEIIGSTMRLWETRLQKEDVFANLYSKEYKQVFKNPLILYSLRLLYISHIPIGIFGIIKRYKKATDYYLQNIKMLSNSDYVSITYDELCKEPDKSIKNVLNFLNLKTNVDFKDYIKPRKLNIVSQVNFLKGFIYKKMKKYFQFLNFRL